MLVATGALEGRQCKALLPSIYSLLDCVSSFIGIRVGFILLLSLFMDGWTWLFS